ncbi:MAG: hypothetical protein B7Z66_14160 [Chromatiales bacterium 21-64-14]|nr:MAG: hypothetical protein B7Z66_14160 [Chromatiales bacterium 21-64-14]
MVEQTDWAYLLPGIGCVIYHLLFQADWSTLKAFGQDPRHQEAGAAVLHTRRQNLGQHVHLHCLV